LAIVAAAGQTKIVLVGDSTVNDEGGWGTGFRASLDPAHVRVVNLALNGRSSKSFRDEGAWAKVAPEKPNYVLIQFGHNDQPGKGPERETDPATTYRANLTRYVDEVRAMHATPVLVTSIVRRNFDSQGHIKRDPLFDYAEATRQVAEEKEVPLIDLYRITLAQSEKMGPAATERFDRLDANKKPDHTHLSALGQKEIGVIAARDFTAIAMELRPYLHALIPWHDALSQPVNFYAGPEARRIAENLLLYQREVGGWDKNIDMSLPLGPVERAAIEKEKTTGLATIDNDSTFTQMEFLARVFVARPNERFKDSRFAEAFRRGFEYLLRAQYPNGGWPQFFPLRDGYWSHITYNDDAMIGVMKLLHEIAAAKPDYAFLTADERGRARRAVEKGIECILKTQVVINGKLTAWCAQHDEHTLAPAQGRAYEHASLSGSESVGVVEFLMSIDHPSPEIIRAIQSAVEWFRAVKISGIRVDAVPAPGSAKGTDRVVVTDPNAPPLWARFYELGTNRPIFSGRDSVIRYQLSEIEYERRNGYRWYVDRPAKLLDRDFPEWRARN
jgi:PelA/Pel-15E family pectate lyase